MSRFGRAYRGESEFDFLGRSKLWFALSGALLLVSVLSLFFRPAETPCRQLPTKGLNCGIEFNGGLSISAPVPDDGPLGETDDLDLPGALSDSLADVGAEDAQIQVSTAEGTRNVQVQTREATSPEQRAEIVGGVSDATGASSEDTTSESISASFGGEITSKALRALLVFLVVIVVFMSWRFEWKMAVGALAALFHDMVITAGIYALVGFEVTPSTVVALLTILGYSLYDTVVVFDKLEEQTSLFATTGRMTYRDAANRALNQVFMRSLNTSLTTLLPVSALLFIGAGLLGASTLEDLALALLIGILAGTYSSIFFATPILAILKERESRYRNVREKVLREQRRRRVTEDKSPVPATVGAPEHEDADAPVPAGTGSGSVSMTKPRAGTKKKRRRKR
ncbi:MAG: protein translocase subunit SecF [Actinobacteria bacterium]|nr:protein translocase subunit SecF [Actinomycetota bacterium]